VVAEAFGECIAHLVVQREVIRIRADDDEAAVGSPAASQIIDKAVGYVKNTGKMHARGHIIIARAAGHKKDHAYSFLNGIGLLYRGLKGV
jgi:hypothetical protein